MTVDTKVRKGRFHRVCLWISAKKMEVKSKSGSVEKSEGRTTRGDGSNNSTIELCGFKKFCEKLRSKFSWEDFRACIYGKYFFLGLGAAFAFAPFFLFPLFLISFGILFCTILEENDLKILNWKTFNFSFGFYLGTLNWIVFPLFIDTSRYFLLIILALILVPTFFAIQLTFVVHILKKYAAQKNWNFKTIEYAKDWKDLLFQFPFWLTLFFWFTGEVFPAIPWVLPCYICCIHEIPLQIMYPWGAYKVSFLILFLSALLGSIFFLYRSDEDRANRIKKIVYLSLTFIGLIGAIILYGVIRLEKNPTKFSNTAIRIVQCNIPQKEKNDHSKLRNNLFKYLNSSYHFKKLDLILWPEAAVPYLYRKSDKYLHDVLVRPLFQDEFLITGVIRKDETNQKVYNSIAVLNGDGDEVTFYDKSRLVPFGEYIPLRNLLSVSALASDIGDFNVGTTPKVRQIKNLKVLFAICYESIFEINKSTADYVDIMINLTNDGWFGVSLEPYQHLQIVRARAVEAGLPVIRVNNFGISAVIDACGRIIEKIPFQQSGYRDIMAPMK